MHSSLQSAINQLPVLLQAGPHIDITQGVDQGGDWGGAFGVLFTGALVVGLLVGGYLALRFLRAKFASSGSSAPPVNLMSKETRRRVNRAMDRGDFEAAGDLLASEGAHEDASEAYVQGGAFFKAARSFHSTGNRAQAIHFYKRAGEFEQAAKLYADDGEFRAAAAEYLQAEDHAAAAAQYEKAGDHRRAADNYERVGELALAGRNFEKAGEPIKAAECYVGFFDQRFAQADADLDKIGRARKLARRAGKLFRAADEPARAAEVFRRAGYLEDAAGSLKLSGDFGRAAELLMQADQPMLAAKVLEEGGEQRRASQMRAEAALQDGDEMTAAEMFESAGEVQRAAPLFEKLGEPGRAAPLYEELEEFAKAATLYEEVEKHGLAARCAEKAGQLARAAELYHEAGDVDSEIRLLREQGDYFRAGRLLFEHRRFKQALEVLSKIDSTEPIYPRTLELAGDIYQAQGRYEKAYSRYRSALGKREAEEATLHLFYKMARALEEEQDLSGAMEHYNAIVEVDAHYEDANLRLKGLRKRMRRGSMTGTTSSGIFAPPDEVDGALARRYEIIEEVARGGMGIVYKARDTVLGRVVAFKILGENLRDNQTAVKYFLREARAAAALSHTNIVTIYDAGEQEGEYYMAMEFVEGTTLKELVQRKGGLDEKKVRYVLIRCCRALHYAHSKGVIHRDIKSGNVMLTRDKALKIMDFGLAKFLREYQNNHTQQVGTPFYMSPEQIIGEEIDFRSDLYGLGCTIFECATGKVPFYKGDLSYHHLHTAPPRPRAMNPKLSSEMEEIILKLLEKDPDKRFQSAKQVLEEFDDS
ncbi:MAG: protein kinase domain-containing protein [Persicimonas sp.]